jgi:Ca-activated chloride channel family protein
VVAAFARAALVPAAAVLVAAPAVAQPVFRSGVDLVHLGVTVVDRQGTPVTGLTAADFEVYEEGRRQEIQYFLRGDDHADRPRPVRVGMLLDTSGSMTDDMRFAATAAIKFLKSLEWAEDITLVDFDTEVRIARFSPADFPRLVERIRSRKPDGWTALYDALGVYLDGATAEDGEKILVLYTDGGDTRSVLSFKEVLDLLRSADIVLYAVGLLEHQPQSTRQEQRLRLMQLAEATGGRAFFPLSKEQLDAAYEQVLQEMAARYTVGYAPKEPRTDGSWRKVTVQLARPELKQAKVRTRKGYFAPLRQAPSNP